MFIEKVALSVIGGLVVLANNFVREGLLVRLNNSKSTQMIEMLDKIQYVTEEGKNNYRNALIFKQATGRYAPIHTINLIFNCYDPCLAARIYSKAPPYIRFDLLEQNRSPAITARKISTFFSWILFATGACLLVLSLGILRIIGDANISVQSDAGLLYVTTITFFLFSFIAIIQINYAGKNLIFLKDVDRFYKGE